DVLTVPAGTFSLKRKVLDAFEQVYNTIEYQPYAGSMKSWEAVADTGAGNDWDQALLLIHKLNDIDTSLNPKLIYATVTAKSSDVANWLGVQDESSAEDVLYLARVSDHPFVPGPNAN